MYLAKSARLNETYYTIMIVGIVAVVAIIAMMGPTPPNDIESVGSGVIPLQVCMGNDIPNPLTCDYEIAGQDLFVTDKVSAFGFKTNAIIMPGNALGSPQSLIEKTPENVKTFMEMTEEEIEAEMIQWIDAKKLKGTNKLIILDIEYPLAHPRFWKDILAGKEPLIPKKDFPLLMAKIEMRIKLAREHLGPNAKISLFGVVTPHPQGKDQNYNMSGYLEAGKLGVYDSLTGITPILYARGDNCDVDPKDGIIDDTVYWPYVEEYTQQAIARAKEITKSDGKTKPKIYPLMSTIVGNDASSCDRMMVSPEYVYRQNAALQKIPGVKAASYWVTSKEEPILLAWLAKTKPVPAACFCK